MGHPPEACLKCTDCDHAPKHNQALRGSLRVGACVCCRSARRHKVLPEGTILDVHYENLVEVGFPGTLVPQYNELLDTNEPDLHCPPLLAVLPHMVLCQDVSWVVPRDCC